MGPIRLAVAFVLGSVVGAAAEPALAETRQHGFLICGGAAGSGTIVSEIYPSGEHLPENLLRFYVYFSQPMHLENDLDMIVLKRRDGTVIKGAFLPTRFQLWSPDRRRLTLVLDPGRVKRGLKAHEDMGRALVADETVSLVMDRNLRDTHGCPLREGATKTFAVTAADVTPPDVLTWQLSAPRAETRDALTIRFSDPLDHVSLAYRLRVRDTYDGIVGGRIELGDGERMWRFVPKAAWRSETYRLVVDGLLEDLAGNRMTGVFDRPPAAGPRPPARSHDLPFTPWN